MLEGLRTVIYKVTDIKKGRDWYAKVLGFEPYFDEPYYVGFNVGGYELGLDPDPEGSGPGPGGSTAYWGVPDAEAAYRRLLDLGATKHSEVRDVGGGIKVGSVRDPFGNILAIIENPRFALP